MLVELYDLNSLSGGSWKDDATIPNSLASPQLVKNSLELCQYVMTSEELASFRGHTIPNNEQLVQLSQDIETRSFRKMWQLEGKDIAVESARTGSRAAQPTYGGVGVRIRTYKQFLAGPEGSKDKKVYNAIALRERPDE